MTMADAAPVDAAPVDAAPVDAAPSQTDATLPDATLADATLADAGPPLAAEFTLTDINPASPTFGQQRSVSGALGKVVLIHFPSFG